MRQLGELVRGFQACAARVPVQATLWLMDALQLCDVGLPPGQGFDAIDTSNLADSLDLLNLLVTAGPRLKRTDSARFGSHPTWCMLCESKSVQPYGHIKMPIPRKMKALYPVTSPVDMLCRVKRGGADCAACVMLATSASFCLHSSASYLLLMQSSQHSEQQTRAEQGARTEEFW